MIELGKYNELVISRKSPFGLYLSANLESDAEVLLPNMYVPENVTIGENIKVFIYKDSEDRLIATTLKPFALVDEIAYLAVKAINRFGAFLDWGLSKELLLPYSEQEGRVDVGEKYLVKIYIDRATNRLTASRNLKKFIKNRDIKLEKGEVVNLIIASDTDIGKKVIINNQYWGLLYKNELFQSLEIGQKVKGFVKNLREDGKIDVSLQQQGYRKTIVDNTDKLLAVLKNKNGFLPLTDKSSPQIIQQHLQMSKKNFKKAVGALYKKGLIQLEKTGLRLIEA